MKAFMLHFALEFRATLRNRNLLVMNYLLPLGFYLLMGGMMVQVNPFFGDQMIPAMVILTVLSGVIMGLPTNMIEAREAGILRSFRVNGLKSSSLMAITALANALHVCLVALIITITAPVLFHVPVPGNWLMYVLIFLLTLIAGSGLATLIGVLARTGQMAILWQQLLFIPSMILSGLMVPMNLIPGMFQRISLLLPATYAMEAFQGLAYNRETSWPPTYGMILLFIGGIAAFIVATHLFSWDNKNDTAQHRSILALVAMIPYLIGAFLLV